MQSSVVDIIWNDERLVYVKPIKVASLPPELQNQAGEADEVYAVHKADGAPLALVSDRRAAFVLARENDYAPVRVH